MNESAQYTLVFTDNFNLEGIDTIVVCPDPGRKKMEQYIEEYFEKELKESDCKTYEELNDSDHSVSVSGFMDFLQETHGINAEWVGGNEITFEPNWTKYWHKDGVE